MRPEQEVNVRGVDRRVFSRMRLTFPLTYRSPIDNLLYRGYCRDIGSGGMGILTDKKLDPETKIELWLETKGNQEPLHVCGKVIWSLWEQTRLYRTYRAGIKFERINLFHLNFNKITDNV